MYVANELKTTFIPTSIENIRENFISNLFDIINKFISDKTMFDMDNFTAYYLDEFVIDTSCNKDIFSTVYLEIDQPLNYKPDTKNITMKKKKKKDKYQIPNLYLSLNDIKKGLADTFSQHFDNNNIIWQDKYSVCMKSSIIVEDNKSENYYFRVIPAFTYYNKDNVHGLVYYSNNEVQIEYPTQFIDNFNKKNKQTKDKFRQTILILKNILLKEKDIDRLPSEIIETLVYNVPNNLISGDDKNTILNIVNFIRNNPLKSFRTIDEQDYAFSSIYRSMSIIYSKHILRLIEKYLTRS